MASATFFKYTKYTKYRLTFLAPGHPFRKAITSADPASEDAKILLSA